MSWFDWAFLFLVIALSFFGFKKGIIDIVVVISSYIAGLAAAAALAGPSGDLIARHVRIPEYLSGIIAALVLFIITALAVRGAGLGLKKLAALVLPGMDRACGLAFGFFLAAGLSALVSVFLYISPEYSAAGELYDESFTPKLLIRVIERIWPDEGCPEGMESRTPPADDKNSLLTDTRYSESPASHASRRVQPQRCAAICFPRL